MSGGAIQSDTFIALVSQQAIREAVVGRIPAITASGRFLCA